MPDTPADDARRKELIGDFTAIIATEIHAAYERSLASFVARHDWPALGSIPFAGLWALAVEMQAKLVRDTAHVHGPADPVVVKRLNELVTLHKLGESMRG